MTNRQEISRLRSKSQEGGPRRLEAFLSGRLPPSMHSQKTDILTLMLSLDVFGSSRPGRRAFTRSLSYVTVELPKFTKRLEELESVADKIFYSLIHIAEMEERPSSFSEEVLVKLFEIAKFASMTTQEQYLYIRTLMAEVDERSQRRTAINKATEQGRAEGLAEGLAEGAAAEKQRITDALRLAGVSEDIISKL